MAADKVVVNAMIVIAADISTSIDPKERDMQRQGILAALNDKNLKNVLEQCNDRGVALAYVEWGQKAKLKVPWQIVRNGKDLKKFSAELAGLEQKSENSTDIADALSFSSTLFKTDEIVSDKKVILVSSDGIQNVNTGSSYLIGSITSAAADQFASVLRSTRDAILQIDITINALVILNDDKVAKDISLEDYYANNVVGGYSSFVKPIADFEDYASEFLSILTKELNQCIS